MGEPKEKNNNVHNSEDNSSKRRFSDTSDEVLECDDSPVPLKKNKSQHWKKKEEFTPEDKRKFIQRFVEISTKYSQFLEKKITEDSRKVLKVVEASSNMSTHRANTTTPNRSVQIKNMKYFEGELHPYQKEGVTWLTVLFENSINGILGDEMGLGKTIQVIALFCYLYQRKVPGPYLIVVPLSTLGNWMDEFARFAPKLPVLKIHGSAAERVSQINQLKKVTFEDRKVHPIVLCSYQLPLLEDRTLQKYNWQYIVVDEGQRLKNPDSKLSMELRNLSSKNRLLLTGTPLQNDLKELWALFNFLMPELFSNINGFSSLILLEDMEDKTKILENEAETRIISTIHRVLSPFLLRREKKFVMQDLTPKKEVIVYCPLTEMQKYIYKAILRQDYDVLKMQTPFEIGIPDSDERPKRSCTLTKSEKKFRVRKQQKLGVPECCPHLKYHPRVTMANPSMMFRKVVDHPYLVWFPLDPNYKEKTLLVDENIIKQSGKLLILDAMLPKLISRGHKILIFSTLVMFLELVEEFLIMRKIGYCKLTGNDSYDTRNENIELFKNNDSISVFLLSTRAGGLGLNLASADTVIFLDRDWNPMMDIQAMARCHRIGQTKPVMVYTLVTKNTIDEIVIDRGNKKRRLERVVIKEGEFQELNWSKPDLGVAELRELEDLLNSEENLLTIRPNGLFYSDQELDEILDRSSMT